MAVRALFGENLAELIELMSGFGERPYRARQVFDALYGQRVTGVEQITTLPAALREAMVAQGLSVGLPEIVQTARSVDGTERYLVRMADGETVETVWMPGGDGGERGDGSEAAVEEEGEADDDVARTQASDARPGAPGSVAQGGYKRATICISSQVGCAVNCQDRKSVV